MRNLVLFTQIRFSMETNAVLYYLSRWPGFGSLIPDTVYRRKFPKILVSVLGYVLGLIKDALAGNLAFLLTVYLIPYQLMQWAGRGAEVHTLLYVILSITVFSILPGMVQSQLLEETRDDILFLNQFMMNPQAWYRQKFFNSLWRRGILILPSLIFVFRDPLLVTGLLSVQLAAVAGSDYFYVTLYSRNTKLPPYRARQLSILSLILLLYAAAFFTPLPREAFPSWFWVGLALVSLLLCAIFSSLLLRVGNLRELAVQFSELNGLAVNPRTGRPELETRRLEGGDGSVYEGQFQRYGNLGAWDYFDRILRLRLLGNFKSRRIRSLAVNIIIPLIAGLLFRYQALGLETGKIVQYSTFMLSVVIGKIFAPSYLDLCFHKMDAPLLYHRFYDAAAIRLSLVRRFSFLMRNGLFSLGTTLLDLVIFLLAAGSWLETGLFLRFILIFALLLFVFESLHLALYYLLQPYSMDKTVRNPLLTLVSLGRTALIYSFLFVRGDISSLLLPLLVLTLAAVGILSIAFKLAPRTFKLRR